MNNIPILFIVFNRPDVTAKVWAEIKKAKPKKLYVACDGSRGKQDEDNCTKVRKIVKNVDWDCDVSYLFQSKNLGCGKAVSYAITWFFKNEELGIILEDDCVPNQSFFSFCEELLLKYKNESRVMCISGSNFQQEHSKETTYYFSRYPSSWGWATWRRAWEKYDFEMKSWTGNLNNMNFDKLEAEYFGDLFDSIKGKDFTWDFQWAYCCLINNGLIVVPEVNLISNIGFSSNATHTKNVNDIRSNIPVFSIGKIVHPKEIIVDLKKDKYDFNHNFIGWKKRLLYIFPKPIRRLIRSIREILK